MRTNLGWLLLRIVLFASLVASAAGCGNLVTVGRDFNYQAFADHAQVGATEGTQIREWLGTPAGIGTEVVGPNRLEVWTYYYGSGTLPGGASTRFKLLQVKLDEQGKLIGWNWSGDTTTAAVEEKSTTKQKN